MRRQARIDRRKALIGLGSLAVLSPIAARGQQPKVPRIGILVLGTPDPALFLRHFREALRDLGYAARTHAPFRRRCDRLAAVHATEVIE